MVYDGWCISEPMLSLLTAERWAKILTGSLEMHVKNSTLTRVRQTHPESKQILKRKYLLGGYFHLFYRVLRGFSLLLSNSYDKSL